MTRPISTSVEFVGGPFCGKHDVITIADGLPDSIGRYQSTGGHTASRRARYDYQPEHTGHLRLPTECCAQPHRGCPLFLHRPGAAT